MAGVTGLDVKLPHITNPRARFYFTEAGWAKVGKDVAANAQREGRVVKVIRRKNPEALEWSDATFQLAPSVAA